MEPGRSAAAPEAVMVKCEEAAGGVGARAGGVGRLVDSTQADDRRMIWLVRERPLLFARSNLPVASYHSEVKKLWREVADLMGWTVAEVRRKWSHIRNSYSRHLRNEIHGVRTGRGRQVSKWYLADELEFLRAHMATDTRPCPLSMVSAVSSFAPHFLSEHSSEAHYQPEPPEEWGAGAGQVRGAPVSDDGDASSVCEPDENASYFQFFRGIYKDYTELSPRRQRRFRRQCLVFLHRLLDSEEQDEHALDLSERDHDTDRDGYAAGGAATSAKHPRRDDSTVGVCVVEQP